MKHFEMKATAHYDLDCFKLEIGVCLIFTVFEEALDS